MFAASNLLPEKMNPLYISKEDVVQCLSMERCIALIEDAFNALASGQAVQPLRSLMWLPDKTGLPGMMPAYAERK